MAKSRLPSAGATIATARRQQSRIEVRLQKTVRLRATAAQSGYGTYSSAAFRCSRSVRAPLRATKATLILSVAPMLRKRALHRNCGSVAYQAQYALP